MHIHFTHSFCDYLFVCFFFAAAAAVVVVGFIIRLYFYINQINENIQYKLHENTRFYKFIWMSLARLSAQTTAIDVFLLLLLFLR